MKDVSSRNYDAVKSPIGAFTSDMARKHTELVNVLDSIISCINGDITEDQFSKSVEVCRTWDKWQWQKSIPSLQGITPNLRAEARDAWDYCVRACLIEELAKIFRYDNPDEYVINMFILLRGCVCFIEDCVALCGSSRSISIKIEGGENEHV